MTLWFARSQLSADRFLRQTKFREGGRQEYVINVPTTLVDEDSQPHYISYHFVVLTYTTNGSKILVVAGWLDYWTSNYQVAGSSLVGPVWVWTVRQYHFHINRSSKRQANEFVLSELRETKNLQSIHTFYKVQDQVQNIDYWFPAQRFNIISLIMVNIDISCEFYACVELC